MFFKYNAVLRGFPQAVVDDLKGNKYSTTIHLIVSGVIKLSRCVDPPLGSRNSTAESSDSSRAPKHPRHIVTQINSLKTRNTPLKPACTRFLVLGSWVVSKEHQLAIRDCPTAFWTAVEQAVSASVGHGKE
jgi:hypothetical protein